MTNREKEIFELIKKDPMISQKEIADALGIARSSVAVHITNLIKKGYIAGKGYIVKEKDYVTVIGGANIDIQGFPKNKLIIEDSNPGEVKLSLGGVGRNIAENTTKLGVHTKLITAVGDDIYGNKIIDECKLSGINVEHSLILRGFSTSTYLSILDENRNMKVAISDMDIFDNITTDFIKEKSYAIKNSKIIILDTNLPKEVIEFIVTNFKDKIFFIDTVSTSKCEKVRDIIGYFHTIKPNKMEAEVLTGIEINNKRDLENAAEYFLNKGVKRVFITLGREGVYYSDGKNSGMLKPPNIRVVNSTGAGDAFVAGLIFSYLNNYPLEYTVKFAMSSAIVALKHENTINPNMSVESVKRKLKELKLC
ncbi:PfkB family carbohydrate kinase [Thermohalobacter berrensis]|uniref:Kinase n=1 Tax=Thermohalobacter berrensis TaxID=99594 RepID=A0A419T9K8_9FIRM|nr:PfkB family carbohydrate kinase [Thermohalobacter berrensis]RKD34155.1 kinase [Thermohalobacter berrensis]